MKITSLIMREIRKKTDSIENKYKDKLITLVLGVTTGGIIPAFMIAKSLGCDYANLRPNKPVPESILNCKYPILIIDDIEDTGLTKKKVMKQFKGRKNVYFETLYNKQDSHKLGWILFPWETSQDKVEHRQTQYE